MINYYSVNNIGAEGMKSIAAALETNATVTNISLAGKQRLLLCN